MEGTGFIQSYDHGSVVHCTMAYDGQPELLWFCYGDSQAKMIFHRVNFLRNMTPKMLKDGG